MSICVLAERYGVKGQTLRKQYKEKISDYRNWDQLKHAHDYLLYPENIGENLSLDEESTQIAYAKACGKMYHAPVFANGDTRKQLLARSIYLLYKEESLWTQSQRIRAEIGSM